jgi:cysteine-rich repeat protein
MTANTKLPWILMAAIITLFYCDASLAADAPAGQVCPRGSYVIGFDDRSNILCSETCGNRVLNDGETCDDGNTASGDGCSADCRAEHPTAAAGTQQASTVSGQSQAPRATPPSEVPPAPPVAAVSPAVTMPAIANIKPRTAVFGAREVTVAISGSGFNQQTAVLFKGKRYAPSVNPAGTELRVTLPTRELPMGYHAITVSNGPGSDTTVKRGLEVF